MNFMQCHDFRTLPNESVGGLPKVDSLGEVVPDTIFATTMPGPGYNRKTGSDVVGKSLAFFSPTLLLQMMEILGPTLSFFGYELDGIVPAAASTFTQSHRAVMKVLPYSPHSLLKNYNLEAKEEEGLLVNDIKRHEFAARLPSDRFGRGIMNIRKGFTNDDANPFEVIPR